MSAQLCPKCGAILLERVVSRICTKSLGDKPTCDFYAQTAVVKERKTLSAPRAIGDEVLVAIALFGQLSSKWDGWRLTPRVVGEINGLPKSRGILVATNGVLCLIEQAQGYYEGHLQWFVSEGLTDEDKEALGLTAPRSAKQPVKERKNTKREDLLLAAYV